MEWLRARSALILPLVLAEVLVALVIDWALGAPTRQDPMITGLLLLGGAALLALKLRAMRRPGAGRNGGGDDGRP